MLCSTAASVESFAEMRAAYEAKRSPQGRPPARGDLRLRGVPRGRPAGGRAVGGGRLKPRSSRTRAWSRSWTCTSPRARSGTAPRSRGSCCARSATSTSATGPRGDRLSDPQRRRRPDAGRLRREDPPEHRPVRAGDPAGLRPLAFGDATEAFTSTRGTAPARVERGRRLSRAARERSLSRRIAQGWLPAAIALGAHRGLARPPLLTSRALRPHRLRPAPLPADGEPRHPRLNCLQRSRVSGLLLSDPLQPASTRAWTSSWRSPAGPQPQAARRHRLARGGATMPPSGSTTQTEQVPMLGLHRQRVPTVISPTTPPGRTGGLHSPGRRAGSRALAAVAGPVTRLLAAGLSAVIWTGPGPEQPRRSPTPGSSSSAPTRSARSRGGLARGAAAGARRCGPAAGASRGTWEFRGPTNIGGRITDLAVDPTNADDRLRRRGRGGRAADDRRRRRLDAALRRAAVPLHRRGGPRPDRPARRLRRHRRGEPRRRQRRLRRGGALPLDRPRRHLEPRSASRTSGSIGRIRVDPADPQRIYVAAMGDLWETGPGPRRLPHAPTAGRPGSGSSIVSDSTGAVDLVLRPDQPGTLFAAMWERIRRPAYYRYGGATCGVYKRTDGGDTWSARRAAACRRRRPTRGRIGLSASAPRSPTSCTRSTPTAIGYFAGLYRTTNGGTSWTRTNDGALGRRLLLLRLVVRQLPHAPDRTRTSIFVLGLDFYRSHERRGELWSEVSGGMHVDHHALEFGPGANPVIYEGNDGGVYRRPTGARPGRSSRTSRSRSSTAWRSTPTNPQRALRRRAGQRHRAHPDRRPRRLGG